MFIIQDEQSEKKLNMIKTIIFKLSPMYGNIE